MSGKDDFVEDLFRDLPKSKPMSDFELKRHEKMILAKIEEMKIVQSKKRASFYVRFQTQFQLAAGFLVLIGGLAFVLNQSSTNSDNGSELAISKPSPTAKVEQPNSEVNQPANSSGGKSNDLNDGSTEFEVGQSQDKAYQNNLGLDYFNQIDQIRAKIKMSPSPLALSAIPSSFGKCAVELGISSKLFAIDKGFYDGQSILALYYGVSAKNSEIWIVEKSCEKIVNLKD